MLALLNTPGDAASVSLADVDPPTPAPNEALIQVRASSVNRGELALLRSRPHGWRPGQDLAGLVLAPAADGSGPGEGAAVIGLAEGGAWADRVAVATDRLAVISEDVPFAHAATLPLAGLAALRTLRYGGMLLHRPVLITGASGGVGRLQVQLASLAGGDVTAVADPQHSDDLRALGAQAVVAHPRDTDGEFHLITESVGGDVLGAAIERLAPDGHLVIFGASSGEATPISLYDFIGHERAEVHVFLSYASAQPFAGDLQVLADLTSHGRLSAEPRMVVNWSELPGHLPEFEGRRVHGKLVLSMG